MRYCASNRRWAGGRSRRLDLAYLYEQEERHSQALAIIDRIQAEG